MDRQFSCNHYPLNTRHETRKTGRSSPCAAAAGHKHADATYIGRALLLGKRSGRAPSTLR